MAGSPYRLSFTTGGLLMQQSVMVAEVYMQIRDWPLTRDRVRAENLLQVRTAAAALRISKEIVARLEYLSIPELNCLVEGSVRERSYLLWIGVCRRYTFIREFATEVLREYFITLRQSLTHKDFDTFFNGKAMWHAELDEISPSTQNKLRQNLFRMLREADLISDDHLIHPPMLTPRLAGLIAAHGRHEFLIFPLGDADIGRSLQ